MKKITQEQFVPFVSTQRESITRQLRPGQAVFVDGKEVVRREMGLPEENIDAEPGSLHPLRELPNGATYQHCFGVFTTTMIELPIVEELPPHLSIARHVNMQLSRAEGVILRRLLIGAQDGPQPLRLKGGRFIQNSADVFRLLLERAGGGE